MSDDDRRVRIVRLWLVAIALCASCLFWPPLWLFAASAGFLAPFFIWCCCPTLNCETVCSDGPTTVSLTVAGIVDEDCTACDTYNQTYVTDQYQSISSGAFCNFDYDFAAVCDPGQPPPRDEDTISLQLRAVSGQANIRVSLVIETTHAEQILQTARWSNDTFANGTNIGAGPLDCGALEPTTLALADDFEGGALADMCDASGSTCEVDF